MSDQRKSLTPGQRRAREIRDLSRQTLNADRRSTRTAADRIVTLRAVIIDLLEVLDEIDPGDGEDGPPRSFDERARAWVHKWQPGDCTCGGHVSRAGVFTPRGVTA